MKNVVISSIFMIFVASCASNGNVSHWQGESLSSLIEQYGTPDSFLKLEDGNRIIEYDKSNALHVAGHFCSLTFMVDSSNRISGAKAFGNGNNCSTH